MTISKISLRCGVTVIALLASGMADAADAPYAWVSGYSVQGGIDGISWDRNDNLAGVTADTMALAVKSYANPSVIATTASASADVATWVVTMDLSHDSFAGFPDLGLEADLRDVFTVRDASGTRADGSAASGLWLDVHMQGVLFTSLNGYASTGVWTRWFGDAPYHLTSAGELSGPDADKQVVIDTGNGYMAQINHVLSLNLCAWGCPSYGVPFDLGLGYEPSMRMVLDAGSGNGPNGGNMSFSISFRTTDPAVDLRVSSIGSYTQPVPEPGMLALMVSGLGVLTAWTSRRRSCG